jgi:hypothetical protein
VGREIHIPAGQVRALQSFGAPNAIARSVAEVPAIWKGRYVPPVHMIKLIETRLITPYKWYIWVRRDRCSAHSIRKLGAGFAEERLPEWAHLFTNSGNHKEIKLTTYLLRAGLRHR